MPFLCPGASRSPSNTSDTSGMWYFHHAASIANSPSAHGHSLNVVLVTMTPRVSSGVLVFVSFRHRRTNSQSPAVRLGPLAMQTTVCQRRWKGLRELGHLQESSPAWRALALVPSPLGYRTSRRAFAALSARIHAALRLEPFITSRKWGRPEPPHPPSRLLWIRRRAGRRSRPSRTPRGDTPSGRHALRTGW